MLEDSKNEIKRITYTLEKLVDAGDCNVDLRNDQPQQVEILADIPRCFKLDLKDFTPPITINIKYHDRDCDQNKGHMNSTKGKCDSKPTSNSALGG